MKPICVECQRFYRPAKNGVRAHENRPRFNEAKPGADFADQWMPYKIWHADLWRCEGCGHQIIVGAGAAPIAEYYQGERFTTELERGGYPVNDC